MLSSIQIEREGKKEKDLSREKMKERKKETK